MFLLTAKKLFRWSLVVIWLALTVYLSSQQGTESGELSHKIAAASYTVFGKFFPGTSLSEYHAVLREVAHFTIHFILAALAYRAFAISSGGFRTGIVISLLFCLLVAAMDEFIQCSSPGRSVEFIDFFHNASGVAFGTLVGILSSRETVS